MPLGHAMRFIRPAKVALISHDQLLITGVKTLLSQVTTIACGRGDDHKAIQEAAPHVVILDMAGEAKSLIFSLKAIVPSAKTLLLAGWKDMGSVRDACCSSFDAIVLTTQPPEVLVATINYLLPPHTQGVTMPMHDHDQQNFGWPLSLTEQERKIVQLVSQGLSNKEIADNMGAASITVRHHLTRIFSKFGVANRQTLLIRTFQRDGTMQRGSEHHTEQWSG